MKITPVVIEQLLNHAEGAGKGSAVAGIYNRHSYIMEKRQAVEQLAGRIRALAKEGARFATATDLIVARRFCRAFSRSLPLAKVSPF